jgi:hypothetical protein
MPTLSELTEELIGQLHGHVDVPAMGTLTNSIDADETQLVVDFGDQPGAARPNGIIEIGTELMVASRYFPSNGQLLLAPWGRGHRGTVKAAHQAGSMVTVRPRFPRKRVIEAINETVRASSPPLYAPRDLDPIETGAFVGLGYELPADTLRVLRVDATDPWGEALAYRRVLRNWTIRDVAGTKLLEIDRGEAFQTIQVTIAATPAALVAEDDDFAATTGLPVSCADVVLYGALSKLVMGVELARQQVISPEAMARADKVPVQSGIAISRYYQALYQQRLAAEQDRQNQQYPIQLLRRG